MGKLKKRSIKKIFPLGNIFFLLLIVITAAGCRSSGGNTSKNTGDIRVGSDGIVVSFVPNNPPPVINVNGKEPINVLLQLTNKGAFPPDGNRVGELQMAVYLSGFDINIMYPTKDLIAPRALEGKSSINPIGGTDIASFEGEIDGNNLFADKYDVTLLATICYDYETLAASQVCIDPEPYSTINQKKVCQVGGLTLTNQGAPIAITKIDEETLSTKTRFRIAIKNVGGGDVLGTSTDTGRCNPWSDSYANVNRIGRNDIDKVYVESVMAGNQPLTCGPFINGPIQEIKGEARLVNGEGFIICELERGKYANQKTAYTTPLSIRLYYAYRNTATTKLLIKNEKIPGTGDSGRPYDGQNSKYDYPADYQRT